MCITGDFHSFIMIFTFVLAHNRCLKVLVESSGTPCVLFKLNKTNLTLLNLILCFFCLNSTILYALFAMCIHYYLNDSQHITWFFQFGEESKHLMVLNPFLIDCHEKLKVFFRDCCDVEDLATHFNISDFSEATLISRPSVIITVEVRVALLDTLMCSLNDYCYNKKIRGQPWSSR